MTPPIRFLALAVGGWAAARVVALLTGGEMPAGVEPVSARAPAVEVATKRSLPRFGAIASSSADAGPLRKAAFHRPRTTVEQAPAAMRNLDRSPVSVKQAAVRAPVRTVVTAARRIAREPVTMALRPTVQPVAVVQASAGRLSGSAWMLARGARVAAVASNGLLGGDQAGARVLYRLNNNAGAPVSVSARVSSPLRHAGAEVAIGVEWQPVAGAPVRLLAERRQRVSGDGRSAWAVLTHGGVSDRLVAGGLRLDAYAQAGVVGARTLDLFADGGATLTRPLDVEDFGNLAVGAGAWGGAQPGAARLDVGPRVTTRIGRARVSLDWRFRVAGEAAPASGPSLTVGTDF